MSNSISLLGLQWGDEGKGKVVDLLSKDIDAAVRYQGGHNAGHTLIIDGKEVVFIYCLRLYVIRILSVFWEGVLSSVSKHFFLK